MRDEIETTGELKFSGFTVRPRRRPLRLVGAAVAVVIVAAAIWSVAHNRNLDWSTVGQYLFRDLTLRGVWVTVYLTIMAMGIGVLGGLLIAVMRLSDNPVLRSIAAAYIWLFRGVPLLVQIIFWGFLGAFYHQLTIGVPFTHIVFYSSPTNALVGATVAAVLALGLNEVAYTSEIVRGGLLAVPTGQREAAYSLGMSPLTTMRRIVIPQAMRSILPPLGNEVISMLKMTALVSVISGHDLLTNLQNVYAVNYKVIPLLVVASIWYLALASLLTLAQRAIERHYGRGASDTRGRTVSVGQTA